MNKKIGIITSVLILFMNLFISLVYGYWEEEYINPQLDTYQQNQTINNWITVNSDAWITYTDTNGRIFTGIWTITIASGDDSITILDRNLGATSSNIASGDSYGYHFQWWNNYWFTWVQNWSKDFLLDEILFDKLLSLL